MSANSSAGRRALLEAGIALWTAALPGAASAQDRDAAIHALEARIAEIEAQTRQQIDALRAELAALSPAAARAPVLAAAMPPVEPRLALVEAATPRRRIELGGDVRLRYESTSGGALPERERAVFRARLRAAYNLTDRLTVGARLVTGDANDPNSSDVTLSRFDDDLDVGLDQAFASTRLGPVTLTGGKFENPFQRTELVWDNDVNPEGVAASLVRPVGHGVTLRAAAIYFPVDEAAAGPDSDMLGGQAGLSARLAPHVELAGTLAYYDYRLRSLAGADAGDFRSNRLGPDGRYLSDFDLLDATASLNVADVWHHMPLRVIADYVRNLGAVPAGQDAYSVDLLFGATNAPHDWRVQYGYASADADGVLAAFSQDNIELATNYRQHLFALDYVPAAHWLLTTTLHHYRVKDLALAPSAWTTAWRNRIRFNVLYSF